MYQTMLRIGETIPCLIIPLCLYFIPFVHNDACPNTEILMATMSLPPGANTGFIGRGLYTSHSFIYFFNLILQTWRNLFLI